MSDNEDVRLFIDSLLNVREAAARIHYWVEVAESTGSSDRQDEAHSRIKLLARLITSRKHVKVLD